MKEVRFRDILACQECIDILKKVLEKIFKNYDELKNVSLTGLRVIAKEFPLVRDKVGYQIRYIDILAINNSNELIIIELKKNFNKKTNIDKISNQIDEYEKFIKENINDLKNQEDFLSIFHYFQLEIFNSLKISLEDIKGIFKVILFIKNSANLNLSKNFNIPVGIFSKNELNELAKKYVDFQINRINNITPGFYDFLREKSYLNSLETPQFRPIPLTSFDNSDVPIFRFESLYTKKMISFPIKKNEVNPSLKLPKIFKNEFEQISNEDITNKLIKGKYRIQIFRSGRANPIFYFEYNKERYIAFHQIKSRLFLKRDLVNDIISYDDTGLSRGKDKKTIFEEVLLFDEGTYKTQIINDFGVKLKQYLLNGTRYNIEFEMIGPKIQSNLSPPLLPFMESDKVKEQIDNYLKLFNINPFSDEWITTNLRVIPI